MNPPSAILDPQSLDAYQRRRVRALVPLMLGIRDAAHRGRAIAAAAARCGLSPKRMRALFDAWLRAGEIALVEKRKLPRGKTSAAARLDITPEERALLRQFALKCDSKQFAIEALADDPRCSAELRAYIAPYRLSRNYPKPLLAAAHVTPQERDLARGHRAFALGSHTQLRSNTYLDDAGEHALSGGDIFECDDMSLNQPYWYEWPYGGDPLSDAFGVRLGRQMLAARDTATAKWIGFDLVGRVRDAYRAEDVVRFLGRIGDTCGLPRLAFRLERGVWMSNTVRGIKGVTDDGERRTIAAISDLVDVDYVYSPKAKAIIEGGFDILQTALALSGIQIGRVRGEYESATRLMLACAAARKHPAECGFPHISEAADRIARAMQTLDDRPILGRIVRGIPQQRFDADVAARPLPRIPQAKRHLFLPVKQVRPIDSGFLRFRVPHYDRLFSFAVPPECAHLGNGYRLLLCFDPADPHAGAAVFDAESERRIHFDSVPGQPYGTFPFAPDAPQLDRRTNRAGSTSAKRGYLAAARTAFRATGMQAGTGASVDQVADGRGSSTRIARGTIPGQAADPRAAHALHGRRKHVETASSAARDRARAMSLLSAT